MSALPHKLAIIVILIVIATCSIEILQRDIVFYLGLQLARRPTIDS
jgi:hypothetical protein